MENLKTYKEKLDFLNENHLYGSDFVIAQEMQCQLETFIDEDNNETPLTVSNEQFEILCSLTDDVYLEVDEVSIVQICQAICRLFDKDREIIFGIQDVIDEICW